MVWQPGQSGNPKGGRKKDVGRAALRGKIAEQMPAVIEKLVKLAKAGDVQAARTLLERVLPPVRPEVAPMALPELAAGTFTERAAALLKAAAAGDVAFDTAARLLTGIAAAARVAEIDELARRIGALEEKVE